MVEHHEKSDQIANHFATIFYLSGPTTSRLLPVTFDLSPLPRQFPLSV